MHLVDLIAILALAQFIVFGLAVASARDKFNVKAPAISGHPMFERIFRVQMNTLEVLVIFLPALFLASKYWSPVYVAATGAVYLIGRIVYWRAYVTSPETRSLGFLLSMLPCVVLLVVSLAGASGLWRGGAA